MTDEIRLTPRDPDLLPLGFEAGLHLSGQRDLFEDQDGKPQVGRTLTHSLEGITGTVEVIAEGKYRPHSGRADRLKTWTETATVVGPIDDHRQLARITHTLVRKVAAGTGRKGHSAPEVYLTSITVRPVRMRWRKPEPKPRPIYRERIKRKGRKVQVIYRDRSTGRFAKRGDWQKSTTSRKGRK